MSKRLQNGMWRCVVKVPLNSVFLLLLLSVSFSGCAVLTTLDHPAAQVSLKSSESVIRAKEVWFSPVDFFDEAHSDAAKVCNDRRWGSSIDAQGLAVFGARTSSRVMNFTNSDSMFGAMEKMNRGFAVCMERIGGGVEYLTTIGSGNLMFAAGAKLTVACRLTGSKWDCKVTVDG